MLTFTISCLFFSLARALPTLLSREVFDPPITSPTASTVWQVGQTVTVTWDTTNLPPASQLTDPNGTVVLGYMTSPTDSEHLMIDSPLAQDFPLSDGQVSFTVPSVVSRTDYIIALFGDSGNISPTFTIQGTDSSSSSSSSVSTIISTTSPSASTSTFTTISTTTLPSTPPSSAATTVVTEAQSSTSGATTISDGSPTSTFTSVITVSSAESTSESSDAVSDKASTSGISSSFASGISTASSSSNTEAAASSNGARRPGTMMTQAYAVGTAGLLAAWLL
ncbi:hypothetical protein EV361DRAFT_881632 [Lentinula raphanica]|uniref:Yeast cell wall synthesis Kre9/Knh1-like N-terminal domain-containing protein n=1 Tax=Lentinula raphanica TaxID=153919 RepID=A0AA38PHL0_9AGAR|nr:hypothetical protein F5880DRAFT_1468102 [Lentinula raphanica]KAJ3842785.1 hypothetical protein F5878DRAFT_576199 [Lentinula raphanica]KAJ3976875.1 hypothetical protein EV361DRAFT_881632 [Lentinula raphanica]